MRISEVSQDVGIDKFVVALRNHIGRAASQKAPAKLNWEAIGQMSRANGFEFAADYETFKSMYDAYPIIQELVKNFNSQGIVLNVPGVSDRNQQQSSPKKDSQAEVDKIAASNAEANLGDSVNNSAPVLAESSNIPQKGSQIKLQWSQEGNDTGVVTGVGADYIKVKLANDKSPHPDTCAIYFDEFAKYKVTPFNPNQKVSETNDEAVRRVKQLQRRINIKIKEYRRTKNDIKRTMLKQHIDDLSSDLYSAKVEAGLAESISDDYDPDVPVNYTLGHAPDAEYLYKIYMVYPNNDKKLTGTYHSLDQAKRIVQNSQNTAHHGIKFKITRSARTKLAGPAGKLPEAIVSQDDPNRDAIRSHQARQHRAGNKISWQQAKQEIDDKLNPPQPKKQRAPKAPRRPSLGMSSARFQKIMKGAAQDFQSDFGDQQYGLEDVAWDLAGSLMHDPEISKYVRGTIARNAGMRPDEVDSNVIQDYIADEIFSAGSANESTDPVDETYFGREIYFIKFTGKPATSIDNIMHNMKKKLVSFEVVDARAATGGEFGNDETEQAFSVDQADGSKIDKWINKTNYVELLDGYEKHGAALLDHTQKIAEISNDLRQRYKEKSAQVIKNVEPYTKKGEYKDLAKRLVARRKAGLDKVNVTDEAIGDAGRSHQAIYQVVCRGNFYAGKYYETGLDSIFVLADSPEEATQIAKNNVDAIVDHFHNKRYKVGSRSIPAIRKNDTQVAVSTHGAKQTNMTSLRKTLTADGKFIPVQL